MDERLSPSADSQRSIILYPQITDSVVYVGKFCFQFIFSYVRFADILQQRAIVITKNNQCECSFGNSHNAVDAHHRNYLQISNEYSQ